MLLRLYDTLTRRKQPFRAVSEPVRIFVCGPTVYDDCHLGHARVFLTADLLARYLLFKGHSTRVIINVTDISNEIIQRARSEDSNPMGIADIYYSHFLDDLISLGVSTIEATPRASDHIDEMIDWIKKLIKLGVAYETDAGVFLNVRKVGGYGKLSGQTEDEIRLRRLELVPGKKNPEDFSLWNKIRKGCMIWGSPWGRGRPGWHIEDTAAASKHLGVPYDINIGGDELIFPHHEALRAQVEPIIGRRLCRFWLHNGMLRVRRKKMSKSLGNTTKVRGLLQDYTPGDIRFYLLSTHYRNPIDFKRDELRHASLALARLRQQLLKLETYAGRDEIQARSYGSLWNRLVQSLEDDLDAPRALAQLRRSASSVVDRRSRHSVSQDAHETCHAAKLLFAILGIPP